MSEFSIPERKKGRTLLVVEGHHEKNVLLTTLFACFPEININLSDVWVYGTNIYELYEDIEKEYGEEWVENEDDIDLPFVISKKITPLDLSYKTEFTNIILMFDYERQDTAFSEETILKLQKTFFDASDMGILYINYPMLESYIHLKSLPDLEYIERRVAVFNRGSEYKSIVRLESAIDQIFGFPQKIEELLQERFCVTNEATREKGLQSILNINIGTGVEKRVQDIIKETVTEKYQKTATYQILDLLKRYPYCYRNVTFWEYLRNIYQQIIIHNIRKAHRIQKGKSAFFDNYEIAYREVNLLEILKKQNVCSCNPVSPYIWVLNTSVFFVADYNLKLVFQ